MPQAPRPTDPQSFLGTGWGFPPTFTRQSRGVIMVRDEEDIRESLWILFSTSPGERLMVPEYGCQLREMIFQALTTSLLTQLKDMVSRAILDWEPRITVEDVNVAADPEVAGLVTIDVSYTVRTTNTRSNFVYPFSLNEATIAPRGP
jgi:phage baseplate assembly protein W